METRGMIQSISFEEWIDKKPGWVTHANRCNQYGAGRRICILKIESNHFDCTRSRQPSPAVSENLQHIWIQFTECDNRIHYIQVTIGSHSPISIKSSSSRHLDPKPSGLPIPTPTHHLIQHLHTFILTLLPIPPRYHS